MGPGREEEDPKPFDESEGEHEEEDAGDDEALRLDNEILKSRIEAAGGVTVSAENLPPGLENEFLQHVLDFEESENGPKRPLRDVFPEGFEFPAADSMNDEELTRKLDAMLDILDQNGVVLELQPEVPDRAAYGYLLEELDEVELPLENPAGMTLHLTGCTGGCDDCFQRPWCKTPDELEEESPPSGADRPADPPPAP
jgi:hypothetical protein